jgi:hypothetical protein
VTGTSANRPDARRRRRARIAVGVVLALGAVAAASQGDISRIYLRDNFGVVDPDRVYRSAQPLEGFRRVIRERGVASVLNLRGGSFAEPWYADEVRIAREEGVDFYDFPMSATRRPSRRELLVLLDFFERCRYPLLIHCKSGSDRTGLASGLYRMAVRGVGPAEAIEALSLRYGHVGLLGTRHLHEPFDEYRAWLEDRRLSHSPERLREWVERGYRDGSPPTPFRPLQPGPRRELVEGRTPRPH